ncbi:hypothetical protein [Tautonia sociabilis]|uniref:Uncharacterized protein n=1 Tax=Tautonia sociabilis TaxID=2080755 RepID=A0A432MEQ4_9BACT|nr:hypothetical protein [Tautonia sociabilis]RUL84031.1 hypothetical protein TsocGM_21150 [Tautonia sociabilis]
MTENHQDKLEAIIDEMLLEDPETSYDTLAKWCARYPEHRDALTRFAATRAVQKSLPEGSQIDEARITSRLMSHALSIMHRQGAAARDTAEAVTTRLCEAITESGIPEEEFSRRCNLDETLIAKLNRRLIPVASIPRVAFELIASTIAREVAFVRAMLTGDPIPLGAHKSRSRPAARTEDFLDAVKSSNLSEEAKSEWIRIIEAERKNEGT